MRKLIGLFLLTLSLAAAAVAQRGEGPLDPSQPKDITPEEVIQRFAAKEKEFKEARENYTYRQEVKIQTVDGGRVDGEYQQIVDITFDDKGRRGENVIYAPQSTLRRVQMTREDLDDIEKRLPFVLTTDEIPEYSIKYAGQQRVDELDTYVLDISPRSMERGRRYFEGRIWVDNRDFQIVKTHGKNVPDVVSKSGENLFPKFTTWREQIDGRYWFPTYTRVDDVLHFKNQDVHIRQIVKYTNYKRFGAKTRIVYEGQEIPKTDDKK
jgi:outer membrane lipoprotein-sorting protein